ncbi:hypothetical protein ACZ90_58430 [Streptomyces albus subsp. albus]|nr:hypothetical protein ACZ90_58430 [Streptomyces albus subsp. albus]
MQDLFTSKDADYLDFPADGYELAAQRIYELAADRRQRFWNLFDAWWSAHEDAFTALTPDDPPGTFQGLPALSQGSPRDFSLSKQGRA